MERLSLSTGEAATLQSLPAQVGRLHFPASEEHEAEVLEDVTLSYALLDPA